MAIRNRLIPSLVAGICLFGVVIYLVSIDSTDINVERAQDSYSPALVAKPQDSLEQLHDEKSYFNDIPVADGREANKASSTLIEDAEVLNDTSEEPSFYMTLQNSLDLDAGLNDQNLMLLKQMSADMFLAGQTEPPQALPEFFSSVLGVLLESERLDALLQERWQGKIMQNVASYQSELLSQRRRVLGDDLYDRLYATDKIEQSADGYTGHFISENEGLSGEQLAFNSEHEHLLDQWKKGDIDEAALRTALYANLSPEEAEQVISSAQYEQKWQKQLEGFLDAYQYVENAALSPEDELQLRQEFIERYFEPEDQASVNTFLFGT